MSVNVGKLFEIAKPMSNKVEHKAAMMKRAAEYAKEHLSDVESDGVEASLRYAYIAGYVDYKANPLSPWRSIKECLPSVGVKVITITDKGKILLVARTGDDRWEHYAGKVTYWMPIPLPEQKEVNNE